MKSLKKRIESRLKELYEIRNEWVETHENTEVIDEIIREFESILYENVPKREKV